jgi:hypothetical protein
MNITLKSMCKCSGFWTSLILALLSTVKISSCLPLPNFFQNYVYIYIYIYIYIFFFLNKHILDAISTSPHGKLERSLKHTGWVSLLHTNEGVLCFSYNMLLYFKIYINEVVKDVTVWAFLKEYIYIYIYDHCLLGCYHIQFGRHVPTLWNGMFPLSSGQKSEDEGTAFPWNTHWYLNLLNYTILCKTWGFHGGDWRMLSSGILCHVALVRSDVSEEHSTSIIRVTNSELGTLAITSNRCMLQRNTMWE